MKLSVVLATYNEADHIKNCLKSIRRLADEIIVVDGYSTDNTGDLAKKLGAKVSLEKNRPLFHINKQIALNKAKGDWILQLDADEVVDKQLAVSIRQLKKGWTLKGPTSQGPTFNGYYLKRKNMFLGRWLKKGGQYPDPVIRLVKRGFAHFPQKSVHEQIKVNGKVGILEGHLVHHTAPTFSRYLQNSNRYTSLTAVELEAQGVKLNLFNWFKFIIIKPKLTFLSLFFRHRGFRDGFPGFIFALFSGFHHATSYMKYWEKKHVKNSY